MNKRVLVSLTVASLLALNFTGCGSSKKSETTPTPTPVVKKDVVGTLVDSPIVGASYACSTTTMKGVTNAKGEFTCKEGDSVTFSVGKITLGSATAVKAGTVVTPYTLGGTSDAVALKIARLVQSLDVDNDRATIDVSEKSKKLTTEIDVKATDFVTKAEAALGSALVSETEAKKHLESQKITSPNTAIPTPPPTTTTTSGSSTTTTSTTSSGNLPIVSTTTTTSGGGAVIISSSSGTPAPTSTPPSTTSGTSGLPTTSGDVTTTTTTSGTPTATPTATPVPTSLPTTTTSGNIFGGSDNFGTVTSTTTSTSGTPAPTATPVPTVVPTATPVPTPVATPTPSATPSTGGACNPLTGEGCTDATPAPTTAPATGGACNPLTGENC